MIYFNVLKFMWLFILILKLTAIQAVGNVTTAVTSVVVPFTNVTTPPEPSSTMAHILFKTKQTNCQMYINNCKISLLIHNKTHIDQLIVESNKTFRFFKIYKIYVNENSTTTTAMATFNEASIVIVPIIVGKDDLFIRIHNGSDVDEFIEHHIVILSPDRLVDKILYVYMFVFQLIMSTFMGLLLDFDTIIKIIKMPFPVLVGFMSQYCFMPLLGYACIKLLNITGIDALALFIYSSCPGGATSNNWTIMFDGDIDLSAIMTFVSTMTSLVLLPAWLYTLGGTFMRQVNIHIPFTKLILNLFVTIGPFILGLALSKIFPKLRTTVMRLSKPIIVFSLIVYSVLTLYVKYYIFKLINIRQWLQAPFIPWIGFLIGAIAAFVCRFKSKQIYTISIETGIQNIGVAFLIMVHNFPSPDFDYAILAIVPVAVVGSAPLWLLLLIRNVRIWFCTKTKQIDKQMDVTDYTAVSTTDNSNNQTENSIL